MFVMKHWQYGSTTRNTKTKLKIQQRPNDSTIAAPHHTTERERQEANDNIQQNKEKKKEFNPKQQ